MFIVAAVQAVEDSGFEILPVSTPSFNFPSATFYEDEEFSKRFTGETKDARAAIQEFFTRISVAFTTHASDVILNTQAAEVCNRIPKEFALSASKRGAQKTAQ